MLAVQGIFGEGSNLPELKCANGTDRVLISKALEPVGFSHRPQCGPDEQKEALRPQKSGSDGAKSRKKSRNAFTPRSWCRDLADAAALLVVASAACIGVAVVFAIRRLRGQDIPDLCGGGDGG